LINEQKATVIIEHLAYDPVEDKFDLDIFTAGLTKQDFSKAGDKLQRHIYDYVLTDSNIERKFVEELDSSKEVVVYAKLPRGFLIPTPAATTTPTGLFRSKKARSSTFTSWPKPRDRCRRWSCGISRKPRSSAPESSSKRSTEVRT
jgi:hypothetical protein